MSLSAQNIAVVAPASPLAPETAEKVRALAATALGDAAPEIYFHPQCFLSAGHFAGTDAERSAAFLDVANDGAFGAVWFARGGYGSCRLHDSVFDKLNETARTKTYLGYSDMGSLLARLYGAGVGRPTHGPMPQDIMRDDGEAAVLRSLRFLAEGARDGIEPTALAGAKTVALNLKTLAHLMSAPWRPDLSAHIVMVEDISEHLYQIDRSFFTVMSEPSMRKAAGLKLGRFSDIPANDRPFGQTVDEIARYWCERAGVPFLGRADIGHDADNKIAPFGEWGR